MHDTPPTALRSAVFCAGLLVLFVLFIGLGHWQLERREWKLGLITQVEQYQNAAPTPAPPVTAWPEIQARDAFRPVRTQGIYLHTLNTCVKAVTTQGPGYWVMTPLEQPNGTIILINRGFVDASDCDSDTTPATSPTGPVTVTGLLRLSEPDHGFLRDNDPDSDRWFARNVGQIAKSRGLDPRRVAPFFIDAEATDAPGPIGGLTVVRFRNHHLSYALTWLGLASLTAFGILGIARRQWVQNRPS